MNKGYLLYNKEKLQSYIGSNLYKRSCGSGLFYNYTVGTGSNEYETELRIYKKKEAHKNCANGIVAYALKDIDYYESDVEVNIEAIECKVYRLKEIGRLSPTDEVFFNKIFTQYEVAPSRFKIKGKIYNWKEARKYFDNNYVGIQCVFKIGIDYSKPNVTKYEEETNEKSSKESSINN